MQNISKGKACLWKGCVNLSPINRWVGTKVNKGTLQPSSYLITLKKKKKKKVEGQSPPGKPLSMIIIARTKKSKSKKQFPT